MAIVAALLLVGTSAQAQFNSALKTIDDVGLTNEDFEMLKSQTATLYENGEPVEGSATAWSNAASESHGTVELTKYDGRCVTLSHLLRVGATKEVHRYVAKRCRADDGRWLIAAE